MCSTFFSEKSLMVSSFQDKYIFLLIQTHPNSQNYKKCVYEPEPHHDFFFTPAAEFKMMVYWGHFEKSASQQSAAEYLDDYGNNFDIENKAEKRYKHSAVYGNSVYGEQRS